MATAGTAEWGQEGGAGRALQAQTRWHSWFRELGLPWRSPGKKRKGGRVQRYCQWFLGGGGGRPGVGQEGGRVTEAPLWLHIYQEDLGDPRQSTPFLLEKKRTPAGFLRPQGKVPGDGFPESNSRRGAEGGRPPSFPGAPERGWRRACHSPGRRGTSEAREGKCKRKQVSKLARTPASPPRRGKSRRRKGRDGSVCDTSRDPGLSLAPNLKQVPANSPHTRVGFWAS